MDAFIGEIRVFGFDYVPEGWALCDGSMLDVSHHQALHSVIENRYGGRAGKTFGLPNLCGRAPRGAPAAQAGVLAGATHVTLTPGHLPAHTHELKAATLMATSALAQAALKQDPRPNHMLSRLTKSVGTAAITTSFAAASDRSTLHPSALSSSEGRQVEMPTMNPYIALNICICLDGEYPVQSDQ